MITHVFLRYNTRGVITHEKRNWSPRTSVHEHYDTAKKRMMGLVAEEYRKPDDAPVPVGMLLVYFSGAKSEAQIPEVYEYTIEMLEPRIVERFD